MAGCPRSGSWGRCVVSWPLSSSTSQRISECSERKEKEKDRHNLKLASSFILFSLFIYSFFHVFFYLFIHIPACSAKWLGFPGFCPSSVAHPARGSNRKASVQSCVWRKYLKLSQEESCLISQLPLVSLQQDFRGYGLNRQ